MYSCRITMENMWNVWTQMARISLESQTVIGIRTAAMMGLLPQAAGENARMVTEKQDAAAESVRQAIRAAGRGASADQILSAALRPYRRRTRANARRLSRGLMS